jgi:Holliday junction resolvase RusA-like endonuclease
VARFLTNEYALQSGNAGRSWYWFRIDGHLPVSLNHSKKRIKIPWVKNGRVLRDRHGKVLLRSSEALTPETNAFQTIVKSAINRERRPALTGLLAAVIVLRSPIWATKKCTVRDEDLDNKIKVLLDGVEKATAMRDCRYWALHAFKVLSNHTSTTVHLFDLGDVVDHEL